MRELICIQFDSRLARDEYRASLRAKYLPAIHARELANPSPDIRPEHRVLTTEVVGVVDDVTCVAPDARIADAREDLPATAHVVRVRMAVDDQQAREVETSREVVADDPRDGDAGEVVRTR